VSPTNLYPQDELLGDPLYSRLKEHLIEATGLAYYADKDADLSRRIGRRLSGLGFQDCASYLELLRDPRRGPSEMDSLIAEITIGETYFFRHREHFDALSDQVLPDLIARNASTRRLRIWCAGCADGAEPYSLSVLLRRELAHLLVGWTVSILGTDINRRNLAMAEKGRFEDWALRSTPESLRKACFEEIGRHWIIAPEYKAGVSFQFHNLVDNSLPPLLDGISGFDLIVCRNVMIYFGPELMQRIVRQFHDCLTPGAWLLVGPSEPNMTCFTSFRAVNAPGVTLYQKPVPSVAEVTEAVLFQYPPPPPVRLPAITPAVSDHAVSTLADLRQRADQGDWEDAARCARELLKSDNLNAQVHFHYALVLEQMGDSAESERSLRRSIYLDREAVLAHYHLGLLQRARGDGRQASRSFENTLALLLSRPATETLIDADGLKVSNLMELVRMQMETLEKP
jgi:chemotaxis protein methyltransferase CheR